MPVIKFRQWQSEDGILNVTDELADEFRRENPHLTEPLDLYHREIVNWFFDVKHYDEDKRYKKLILHDLPNYGRITEALTSDYDDYSQQELHDEFFGTDD